MRPSPLLAAAISLLLQACIAEPGPVLERGTGDALSAANGRKLNGRKLNGRKLNGRKLNGRRLNGTVLHGLRVVDGQLELRDELDRVVSGKSLAGVIVEGTTDLMAGGASSIRLQITNAFNGAEVAGFDRRTWLYDVRVLDESSGQYEPLCDDGALVTPIQGYWDETARHVTDDPDEVTLACMDASLGKCVAAGYLPHQGLADYHQACVRMLRADYCGDGHPMTQDGTAINMWDNAAIQTQEEGLGWGFEAKWGPDGATCVSSLRFGNVQCDRKGECVDSPLDYVMTYCPYKMTSSFTDAVPYDGAGQGWGAFAASCDPSTGFDVPLPSLLMNESSSVTWGDSTARDR